MTAIDLAVIGVVFFALYSFTKTVRHSKSLEFKAGQALTLIGIAVLGIFYSLDLFSMWVLPQFVTMAEAMAFMEQLHLDYMWMVTLIVLGTIITGYVLTNRSIVSLQQKLERPRKDLSARRLVPAIESGEKAPRELIVLSGFIAFLVLAFDLSLPLGIAGGVPYVALVLLGGWFPRAKHIIVLAVAASALTTAGFFLSPVGGELWVVLINRGLALFAIWITATLIANRKQTEERLRDSEERFRSIIDHSPSFITLKDTNGRIELVNQEHASLWGCEPKDIVGKSISEVLDPKVARDSAAQDRKVIETKSVVVEERAILTEKGTFDFLVTKFPILDRSGAIKGVGTIGTDISDRKRAENEINFAMKEAERANSAKSEFLSSMNHELRTPLNAILGFTQLLNSDPDHPLTEKQLDATEQVLKAGDHLLSLIDKVLDLAAIESGKVSLDIEAQDPTPVIESCAAIARNLAEQKGLAFHDRTAGWQLPEINIDETRFRQVLLNLLSNAVKYNRDGGTVTLAIEEAGTGVIDRLGADPGIRTGKQQEGGKSSLRISVIDSGIGIAAEKHDQIFTPFSRLGLENSDITGSGIGLTITRELVEAMGGSIGFESTLGLGSTFWLEFPIVSGALSVKHRGEEPAAADDDDDADADAPSPRTRHTVLCVEDNPSSLKLLQLIIERIQGTAMISAHTGELGVDLAEIHQPNVILMDLNLPGIDGIEALKRLKASSATKDIPVIALTARASKKDKAQGLEAGFADYLTKPINVREVTSTINRVVGQAFQDA
jgi:PAS domain S-box-containing protein